MLESWLSNINSYFLHCSFCTQSNLDVSIPEEENENPNQQLCMVNHEEYCSNYDTYLSDEMAASLGGEAKDGPPSYHTRNKKNVWTNYSRTLYRKEMRKSYSLIRCLFWIHVATVLQENNSKTPFTTSLQKIMVLTITYLDNHAYVYIMMFIYMYSKFS